MTDQLLGWLSVHGLAALFGILAITAIGLPFPVTLLLLLVGSFVDQGELELLPVIVSGSAGAILGDQIGYLIGWWGGRRLARRIADKMGGDDQMERAKKFTQRWGGAGIFFSRWLVTPLGPWINLTSGITGYPWSRFIVWDVLGEIIWVCLYVMLGKIFSDRVQDIADLLGNLTWILLGLIAAGILGWKFFRYFRGSDEEEKNEVTTEGEAREKAS